MVEKKVDKIAELKYNLSLVVDSIKNNKFSHAVSLFSRVESEYDSNNPKIDSKTKKQIEELKKEFILYLRINEAYTLAELGNLAGLRSELEYIRNSVYDLEYEDESKPLINYLTGNYKFCLEYYTYKITKRHFIDEHQSASQLIKNGKLSNAKKKFSQLIILYNKLQDYLGEYEKEQHYAKLKDLFKEISTEHLVNLHVKQLPEVKLPKMVKQKKEEKAKFHNNFNDLRKMIESGEVDKATEILKKV